MIKRKDNDMKISQLTTDQALDAICEITPAVEDIITDDELIEELKKKIEKREGMAKAEKIRFYLEKITKLGTILLKKKREAVYTIVAALNQTDVDTVRSQNIIKTMTQIKEIANDEDFANFVYSCWKTEESAS